MQTMKKKHEYGGKTAQVIKGWDITEIAAFHGCSGAV